MRDIQAQADDAYVHHDDARVCDRVRVRVLDTVFRLRGPMLMLMLLLMQLVLRLVGFSLCCPLMVYFEFYIRKKHLSKADVLLV